MNRWSGEWSLKANELLYKYTGNYNNNARGVKKKPHPK